MGEQGHLDSYSSARINRQCCGLLRLADDTHIEPGVTSCIIHSSMPDAHSHTTLAVEVSFPSFTVVTRSKVSLGDEFTALQHLRAVCRSSRGTGAQSIYRMSTRGCIVITIRLRHRDLQTAKRKEREP